MNSTTTHADDIRAIASLLDSILTVGGELGWCLIGNLQARAELDPTTATALRASCESALRIHAGRTSNTGAISPQPSAINTPS